MEESILKTTKKILGLAPDYTAFDLDVVTHINSVFSTLQQLGVGPEEGFFIEGESELWPTFISDDPVILNAVKSYMYLRVRLLFDPPPNSFALTSCQEQINQLEWRLQVMADPPVASIDERLRYA